MSTYSKLVTVTPKIAGEWLKKNTGNRKPKLHKIAAYARDMRVDDWRVNGDQLGVRTHTALLFEGC